MVISNNLLVQWGNYDTGTTIIFPTAFSTINFAVTTGFWGNTPTDAKLICLNTKTVSSVKNKLVPSGSYHVLIIAIGY